MEDARRIVGAVEVDDGPAVVVRKGHFHVAAARVRVDRRRRVPQHDEVVLALLRREGHETMLPALDPKDQLALRDVGHGAVGDVRQRHRARFGIGLHARNHPPRRLHG